MGILSRPARDPGGDKRFHSAMRNPPGLRGGAIGKAIASKLFVRSFRSTSSARCRNWDDANLASEIFASEDDAQKAQNRRSFRPLYRQDEDDDEDDDGDDDDEWLPTGSLTSMREHRRGEGGSTRTAGTHTKVWSFSLSRRKVVSDLVTGGEGGAGRLQVGLGLLVLLLARDQDGHVVECGRVRSVGRDAEAKTASRQRHEAEIVVDVRPQLAGRRHPEGTLKAGKHQIELATVQAAQADVAVQLGTVCAHREDAPVVEQSRLGLVGVEVADGDARQRLGVHRIEGGDLPVAAHRNGQIAHQLQDAGLLRQQAELGRRRLIDLDVDARQQQHHVRMVQLLQGRPQERFGLAWTPDGDQAAGLLRVPPPTVDRGRGETGATAGQHGIAQRHRLPDVTLVVVEVLEQWLRERVPLGVLVRVQAGDVKQGAGGIARGKHRGRPEADGSRRAARRRPGRRSGGRLQGGFIAERRAGPLQGERSRTGLCTEERERERKVHQK
uniref:Uncharacterized protein n=1 Tax=Anopheles atroparvus TaxID=41427 RepID=A0A182JJE7_ANOAO